MREEKKEEKSRVKQELKGKKNKMGKYENGYFNNVTESSIASWYLTCKIGKES